MPNKTVHKTKTHKQSGVPNKKYMLCTTTNKNQSSSDNSTSNACSIPLGCPSLSLLRWISWVCGLGCVLRRRVCCIRFGSHLLWWVRVRWGRVRSLRSCWVGLDATLLLRACRDDSGSGRGWLRDSCKSCAWAVGSLCNAAANDNTDNDGDDDKEHNRCNCWSHNNPNNIGWREKHENTWITTAESGY